jgi:putative ABC transport system permease protein
MTPFALIVKSLRNRRCSVGLTVASIALSVALLFGVERIRREAQTSFTNTISGTDLIIGARTGAVQLLLSAVFRIGNASNSMEWESYEEIASHPAVAWAIPVSLGDSHRGYRVMGTTDAYFKHLRYGRSQALRMGAGAWFAGDSGAVLGAEVARKLDYAVGDALVVAHGAGDVSFIKHDEHPFRVAGILAPTGTPVDRTVHVSLLGMDAIHEGMTGEQDEADADPLAAALAKAREREHHAHVHHEGCDHEPGQITACFIGLKSRSAALGMQRMVNQFKPEPLSAVLPALALQELWEIVGIVERALLAVSGFVVLVGLAGMLVAIMTSINQRRREMAILRSVGARPVHVLGLIVAEATLVTSAGVVSGFVLLYGALLVARPILAGRTGLVIAVGLPSAYEFALGGIIILAGFLIGLVPGYRSYRYSLADGLTVRT